MKLTFKTLFLVCLLPFVHPGPIEVIKNGKSIDPDSTKCPYRLPEGLKPNLYRLTLAVDLAKVPEKGSTYTGTVEIVLDVTKDVMGAVKLHKSDDITINEKHLVAVDDEADPPTELLADKEPVYDSASNIVTLALAAEDTTLTTGKQYLLTLKFTALFRDDMYGFYKSSYVDSNGETHWLVTTQFESVYARAAFPCFDEPSLKANYFISIEVDKASVDKGYHALSNMPLKSQNPKDGETVLFEFDGTPLQLSSYLVAFIVSDFKGSNPVATFNDGKPFTTWGQQQYLDNKEDTLSQTAGPAVLDIYADILGINFAYPKIDQVGVPDFSAGAMENWGLTTYRERMLFFNEESNSIATKQSTVAVTAHELAHQWFGDLVTLHFWDDIWLNEGFADYFEYHGSAKIKVEGLDTSSWNYVGQFVVDEIQSTAFEADGLESARALTSEVCSPKEIEPNFDSIAYSKGGSVIRMWQHVLTDEVFFRGLNLYLSEYKGANGRPEYLLENFQKAVDEITEPNQKPNLNELPVKELFQDWHLTAGYPVLTVNNVDKAKYNFTQNRFLWKIDEVTRERPYKWYIPISYSTLEKRQFENKAAEHWLTPDEAVKEITFGDDTTEKPTWIIINNQQAGYYRVNYDEENWKALADQLKSNLSVIDEINRAQIIDDALSLSRSTQNDEAYLTYDIALGLTTYLSQEEDYLPWAAASNAFGFLNTKLSSSDSYQYFRQHVLNAVKDRYDQLGLEVKADDTHLERLLRIVIASWACKLDHDKCITDAVSQFNNKNVAPDVKSIVYCTAVRNNAEAWNQVWEEYNTTDNNLDQTIFLSALGCTKDEETLKMYLEKTIDPDGRIRTQDASAAFSSVYNGNPGNVKVALNFLSTKLTEIANTYGGTDPLGKILLGLASKVVAPDDIQSLNDTIAAIKNSQDPVVQRAIKSADLAMDTLTTTEHWLEKKQTEITTWLKDTYDEGDGNGGGGGGGAAEVAVSVLTVVSCLALLLSS